MKKMYLCPKVDNNEFAMAVTVLAVSGSAGVIESTEDSHTQGGTIDGSDVTKETSVFN